MEDGFKYFPTTNFSDPDIDNQYDPPEFYFELPQFINPRETTPSDPWNITIYNADKDAVYIWNTTNAPTVRMSGAATPGFFKYKRGSDTNGNLTWYEFHVKTTNYLVSGDRVRIELPFPVFFSEDSACIGRTANLDNLLFCRVSVDLSRITMELSLPSFGVAGASTRSLQTAGRIDSGEEFMFRITNIKNPPSFEPTPASIIYEVFTTNGNLIEELLEDYPIVNTEPGALSPYKNGLLPDEFQANYETNYTLEVYFVNYK